MRVDSDVRTMDMMSRLLTDAEAEHNAEPHDAGKLMKYVEVLVKTEQPDYENKAIDLLTEAYDRTKSFRFRQNVGKIRMAQMNRMERSLRQAVQSNPQDADAKQQYAEFVQEKLREELAEYRQWVEAYPTDTPSKWEVAKRLVALQEFGEAIPALQQMRSDPKYRTDAGIELGKAFLSAGFADEAVDTLAAVIGEHATKGDKRSVEMTYWYGRSLEDKKDVAAALKAYSQVAQWDFNYRDTQARIKKLRATPTA